MILVKEFTITNLRVDTFLISCGRNRRGGQGAVNVIGTFSREKDSISSACMLDAFMHVTSI